MFIQSQSWCLKVQGLGPTENKSKTWGNNAFVLFLSKCFYFLCHSITLGRSAHQFNWLSVSALSYKMKITYINAWMWSDVHNIKLSLTTDGCSSFIIVTGDLDEGLARRRLIPPLVLYNMEQTSAQMDGRPIQKHSYVILMLPKSSSIARVHMN